MASWPDQRRLLLRIIKGQAMLVLWFLMTFWVGFACGQAYTNWQYGRAKKLFDNNLHVPEPDLVPLITKPDRWTEAEWQEFKNRDDRQKEPQQ
jgi:hypothetical protein